MEKLISMTDFCLQLLNENAPYNEVKMLTQISNYANFLKQPLTLGMFVPCDEGGNVLEQPCDVMNTDGCRDCACRVYKKAKEKVLFEGCSTIQQGENTIVMFNDSAIWLTWTNRIVEDLLKDRVILTKNATKQFL